MKTSVISHIRHRLRLGFLFVALCAIWFFTAPTARAGLTFEVHVVRFNQGQAYKFFTPLYTNSTAPLAPFGNYFIYSPHQPTNGSWREIQVSAGGANTLDGAENFYSDFNSLMQQITNGTWNIIFTNSTTTNHFTFTVSAPNVTSNALPATIITFPLDGALNISNTPTFTWQGPKLPLYTTNTYIRNYDFSFYEPVTLPPGQTNWTVSPPIPNGLNGTFNLSYITNYPASIFVATTPLNTNASHQAISEWDSVSTLETDDSVNFAVTNPPVNSPVLIAHYTFDDGENLGHDSSGNGYDLDFNGGNGVTSTNAARVGNGAAYFDGGSFFSYNSTPGAVLNAFVGDFSLSFWIKTTQDDGNENGEAFNGDGIVTADVPGQHYDLVPAALDGGQIGFNTGPDDDTVNSQTDINQDGNYHHVVVTRDQTTGEKKIYIDGALDNSDFATLNPLSDPHLVAIGCAIDASQFDPNSANTSGYFRGLLDDLQIYSGVLSSNQVVQLFENTSPALVAHYTFDDSDNLGADTSGHGYDLDFNGGNGVSASGDAAAGSGAADFDGGSFFSYNSTPAAVLNAFAGDFSLSFWIKTDAFNGNEGGFAFNGAGIVSADIPGQFNDLIPAALDGGEIGFNTGPDDNTLNSQTDINQDGNYHHVVVTRDQTTGEKKIYIDGTLNSFNTDNMNLLDDPVLVAVGCAIDASQSDPNNADPSQYFQGLLDDIQIYSVVLSSDQVAQLFANPGSIVTTATVSTGPVITFNPFNQTNYPGYNVALFAAANGDASLTWQWFKVGNASPVFTSTNALFIPTNSGNISVAGNYYAVATDAGGSANTTTAAVTFVSAPLPPDWSRAVKSPFKAEFDTNIIKDYYGGCVVDSAGEVYIADQYVGNVIVQTNFVTVDTLTAAGTYGAAALVKHDANGIPLWAVGLTNNQTSSSSYAVCVALAPGGGAYLASSLTGTNWLGTNQYVNNNGNSILLSRFDANGSNVWSRLIGQTNQVFTLYNTLVSDPAGTVTLGGVINGTADFGGTNLAAPGFMGFLAQYNTNGTLLWAQLLPTFPQNVVYNAGRLYVSLSTTLSSGVTNAGIGNLSIVTDRAWAVACLAATNGQAFWLRGVGEQYGAKTSGNISDDIPLLSVSGSDVFLTGTAYGSTAVFGGFSVSLSGGRSQYFARYDTNGNAQVATAYGSTTTMPWASAANASGVYISGDFDNYSQFGSFLIAAPMYAQSYLGPDYFTQPFVAKFDRNGNALWARNGVSSTLGNFRGIATAADGVWASGIVLVSDIFHPAQFGTNTVFSDGYIYNFGTGIIFLFTQGGLLTKITDGTPPISPVTIINPALVGTNFQFSFVSTAGYTNNVESRTNLALGSWQFYTNFTGDGTLKTVLIPKNNPPVRFFRVRTQ